MTRPMRNRPADLPRNVTVPRLRASCMLGPQWLRLAHACNGGGARWRASTFALHGRPDSEALVMKEMATMQIDNRIAFHEIRLAYDKRSLGRGLITDLRYGCVFRRNRKIASVRIPIHTCVRDTHGIRRFHVFVRDTEKTPGCFTGAPFPACSNALCIANLL